MPKQSLPEFKSHEVLEADIKQLVAEIQKHQERPETRSLTGPELLKKSIQSMTAAQQPAPPTEPAAGPLPQYAENAPTETKLEIEYLLDMAFHHGIAKANSEAMKSNPFVLDAFHDALVGKLYPELRKRGILK
jgi:hypothetical protein